jgi:hypothetical protein
MERFASRRCLAAMLATGVAALMFWPAIAQANDRYVTDAGIAIQRADRMSDARAAPSPYFADIPMTVTGVYGGTMLDMLAGGPILLVRWPNGCCSRSHRWHIGHSGAITPVHPKSDRAHVFFLWPQS